MTESQTASHVCNSRRTALPRAVLDPDDVSETAFLTAVPCTVFENHWHRISKDLSELINFGNFLHKLVRFRLFSAFPCWPFHGQPTTLFHIDIRNHIRCFPAPPSWGGGTAVQAGYSAHALINANGLGTRLFVPKFTANGNDKGHLLGAFSLAFLFLGWEK